MVGAPTAGMRIMLATDDSASARTAEEWVTRLRFATDPTIDVVCVAGRSHSGPGWGLQTYRGPVRAALESQRQGELYAAERIANEVGERLQRSGLAVRTWARQGDCCEELLAMAEVDRPDLVVAGPRGRSGLAAAILGSVTQGLIAHTAAPLLVARPPRTNEGQLPAHVLLVVEPANEPGAAVAWLHRAGWLTGGRVTVLGLLGERAGLEHEAPGTADAFARLVGSDAMATLEHLALPFAGDDVAVDYILRGGHPLQATLDAAEALLADLVAVGRPPRPERRDSFAQKVARHSSVSVLLVPAS